MLFCTGSFKDNINDIDNIDDSNSRKRKADIEIYNDNVKKIKIN